MQLAKANGIAALSIVGLAVDPTDSQRVYWGATGQGGGLYRSDDAGATWNHVFTNEQWIFNVMVTSDGTVYPLLNRLRDAGLVTSEWQDNEGERARRYYSITQAGHESLAAFRADWAQFSATVGGVLNHLAVPNGAVQKGRQ